MSTVELALMGQVLLWLIVIGVFALSRQATLFHPLTIYLGFHGLVFVTRPLLVHYLGFDSIWRYMRFEPTDAQWLRALAVSSVALTAFAVTCFSVGRVRVGWPGGAHRPFSVAEVRALVVVTLALLPIILYSMRTYLGGGMKGENLGGVFIMTGSSGYSLEAQFMAGPLICAWLAVMRFRWWTLLPVALYLAYRAYVGWNRWTIVLLVVAIVIVHSWQNRRKWVPVWALVAAVPLYALFSYLGQDRGAYVRFLIAGGERPAVEQPATRQERLVKRYDTQDFANFDYLCFVVSMVPERTGKHTWWAQYLALFTEPIPRKLWKGKPIGAPVRLFNLNAYGNFNGLTPSLAGDGWMSAGWFGVILTMGAAGALLGLAHRWFWMRSGGNLIGAILYMVGLAMLPQWFRDGGISIMKFLFWNLSPLLMWAGATWLLGNRMLPSWAILIPGGQGVRASRPAPLREAPVAVSARPPQPGGKFR